MAGLHSLLAASAGTVMMALAVLAREQRARRRIAQRRPSARARSIASRREETPSFW
jgi:hypothetical protein